MASAFGAASIAGGLAQGKQVMRSPSRVDFLHSGCGLHGGRGDLCVLEHVGHLDETEAHRGRGRGRGRGSHLHHSL
eukprot:scaffold100767_cov45-Phaeocystis_antarctica.AAC.2